MAFDSYDHLKIEKDAQARWNEAQIYTSDLDDTEREPYYLLTEFPYPSGDLHIGHWYAFALPDIYARYLRMKGKNVLFPFGFDAFGLPAENAAIQRGLDPKEWTYNNMDTMRAQIRSMGGSFDWSKEVVTCDPGYYQWTQWLFSKLYEHGLAERKLAPVKWCPFDQTVLANEQVIDGKCERCGHEVEERNLTQWFLKITQYAKRLLDDLDPLPWREEIKDAQRAWIGESEGAKIFFDVHTLQNDDAGVIDVFTTRPDTIYGATYVVIAPEHPLVTTLLPFAQNKEAIEAYQAKTRSKTERERSENKEKTGVILEGISAVNPATQQELPVYIADYVLASYGTGAVMAVPAHDERDFEFAQKHNLPMVTVVEQLFAKTTGSDAVQVDLPLIERHAVVAVVKHSSKDEYIVLNWKANDWCGFVVGGIEEGEDLVTAARREVHEETGYKNLKHVGEAGEQVHSQFYHELKKQNRFGHFDAIYFELEDEERDEMAEEEKAIHEVVWVAKEKVAAMLSGDKDMAYIWEKFLGKAPITTQSGILIHSAEFSGRNSEEAKWEIVEKIQGERVTNYRIRDWLVSRQRYWGCPIPVVYDPEGEPHLVPSEHLPWLLPTDVDFTPQSEKSGKSPLATSKELQERVERIFGKGWTPEYDTLDTFVDSSWYFARYLDNADTTNFSDAKRMKNWLPVNRYSGGSEHTTMHLLYARFFYKALHDLALVPTAEPFEERFNRGIILGPDHQKMSKSKGNVINPDEFVTKYGADAVRMYLAFIGPFNEPGQYPWNLDGVHSMRKFLERVIRLSEKIGNNEPSPELSRAAAKASARVGGEIERFKFNTAISALMVFIKELEALPSIPRSSYRTFLTLLAPFAPHLADHLWNETALESDEFEPAALHIESWPEVAASDISEETKIVIVQINGKKRGELQLPVEATEADALAALAQNPTLQTLATGKEVLRTIYVPGRIINFVLKGE